MVAMVSAVSLATSLSFFTTPETLGDYVLVDFVEHRRKLLSSR